jgi:hypothetical protein
MCLYREKKYNVKLIEVDLRVEFMDFEIKLSYGVN